MITYGRLTNQYSSISGLLAARVCLDHFEEVVLVEAESWLGSDDAQRRDTWNQEHTRSRVMQYNSFHGLSLPLYINDFLDALQKHIPPSFIRYTANCSPTSMKNARFPTYGACLSVLCLGCTNLVTCRPFSINPADFRFSTYGDWQYVPYEEYGGALPCSTFVGRTGLENLLRRLVLGGRHEHVRQIIGTVTGVSRSESSKQYLDKVIVRTEEGMQTLDAVLVMGESRLPSRNVARLNTAYPDCTGPVSAGMKWIRREGFGVPESGKYPRGKLPLDQLNIKYDPNVYYSTLRFHVPPEVGAKFPGLTTSWDRCSSIYVCLTEAGVDSRAIYCQRIEGDIGTLSCAAFFRHI